MMVAKGSLMAPNGQKLHRFETRVVHTSVRSCRRDLVGLPALVLNGPLHQHGMRSKLPHHPIHVNISSMEMQIWLLGRASFN